MTTTIELTGSIPDYTEFSQVELKHLHPTIETAIELLATIDPDLVSAFDPAIEPYLPKEVRAKVRAKAGTTTTTKKVKVVESIEGVESYPRPNGQPYFARKWGEHNDVEVLRKAREAGQYVMLYGVPGTGKTACVEAAFGDDLYTLLGSGDTEVSDLVGGYVQTLSGNFEWVDGVLLKAASEGKVLFIDEVGLIDPKVMAVVYGLMDGRKEYVVTANPERGVVKAQEGFYVVSATNPNVAGVRLSEALLSRFTIQVEMTTDWNLARKLGVSALAIAGATNLSKKQQAGEVSWSPQMRELLAFRDLSGVFGTKWALENLIASSPEIDRVVVAEVISRAFGEEVKPAKI